MSEELADFVRDIYDDYVVLRENYRFHGRVRLNREQTEEKIIEIIRKLEKI